MNSLMDIMNDLKCVLNELCNYAEEKPPSGWSDDTLAAIEGAIIESTGDGEFAAYVVRFLETIEKKYEELQNNTKYIATRREYHDE